MYHREKGKEAFLVLAGERTLIVEGEERRLATWDFFYCAPGTEHIIVATGQQSAVALSGRCARPRRRRRDRLHGLQGCGSVRSERRSRNYETSRCLCEGSRGTS
jgi:glyoxylate utilization-related uncharacterized protein